jgi:acyl-homoserine lactone acylase PvdQ
MPKLLNRGLLLCLVLLAACSREAPPQQQPKPVLDAGTALATAEHIRQEARAANVTIIRDDFGVPHIYGKSDADAVFGLLYAQSEDDFPRLERNYIWAMGRLAEVQGESALYSDLRARLYMTEIEAREAYKSAPDWLKSLCIAFADGINYYLRTHPEVTPALITRFEPWMPMYFFEGSIGGDIEQIPLPGIEAFYGSRIRGPAGTRHSPGDTEDPTSDALVAYVGDGDEPRGSNGIAISGALTQSGKPLLLINPHTSFFFRGEVHMVSEEGLNAYGAVTWGQFFIYQGFNEHTGWMHTSTYVDFLDEFIEDIVESDGRLSYRYGDKLRPVRQSDARLKVRTDRGMEERHFPMYHTHHGPITHEQDGKWVATKINWDPVNALRQSWLRTRQSNHDEFREMMQIRTNSSNNTVYADSSGNIAYYHGNFIPRRNAKLDYSKPVDGSDPNTDWQGLHSVDETISLLNPPSGWLQNCNSTPFTAAGAYSPDPGKFPTYMAPDPENFRGVHAVRLMEASTAAGNPQFTIDSLIELAYDPALPAFEVLIPPLVEAWSSATREQLKLQNAIDVLSAWDKRVSAKSSAMTLAHFYGLEVLKYTESMNDKSRMERIQDFAARAMPQEQIALLSAAAAKIEADFGQWNTAWGEVNRYQRLDGAIEQNFDDNKDSLAVGMASGRWGALAAFGAKAGPDTRRIYGYRGNSFVAVVEFGDKVRAKSLLAGGQSGDPASPHFADQAQPYVDRQFKDVAFYRADVEARAQRTYHPGQGKM